jgi:hypothetical protein
MNIYILLKLKPINIKISGINIIISNKLEDDHIEIEKRK